MRQVLILIAAATLFCAHGALLPPNDANHDREMDAEVRRVSESNADLKLIGHFQNKLYFSDFVSVPFHIASQLCSESGLHLLRVNYEEHHNYIVQLVQNITASNPSRFWFWTGTSSNVTYIWEDGSPIDIGYSYTSVVNPVLVLTPYGGFKTTNMYNLHLDYNTTAMCYATLGNMPQI